MPHLPRPAWARDRPAALDHERVYSERKKAMATCEK